MHKIEIVSDEAFQRGYDDEMAGVSWLANPYKDETLEARRWVDGKVKAIQDKRAQTMTSAAGTTSACES